jgi:pimeloyl-ACP methyl ester carboxylesterase
MIDPETDLPEGIRRARVGDLQLAYETFGDEGAPPVLLVMGLGAQMLVWPDGLCAELASRGLFVVRYDNRDVGLSTHLDHLPPANLPAIFVGDRRSVAYSLSDMAADAVGLLDALGLESAHVVGASMGGMIAQLLAIEHPERVRSLTSMMSTTGDRGVGGATEAAVGVLVAPPPRTPEQAQDRALAALRVVGSPGFAPDEARVRDQAARAFARGHDPAGVSRQLAAVLTAADRTPRLRALGVPTLVIHGADDPLVQVSGGRATAAAVPGAELDVIEGMGHDLPRELWPRIADRIAALVARVEAGQEAA